MAEFSDYVENTIINEFLRNTDYTPVATVYVALFTAVTGLEADSGVTGEVSTSGTAYARVAAGIGAPSGGAAANGGNITWTTATASWGTVSHFAIVDHATNVTWGTNVHVLMYSALDASKAVETGDTAQINTGDLDVVIT